MQDLQSAVSTRSYVSDSAGVVRIGPGNRRLALFIGSATNTNFYVLFGTQDGSNAGPRINNTTPPLALIRRDVGSGIDSAFVLINAAGTAWTANIIEFVEAP